MTSRALPAFLLSIVPFAPQQTAPAPAVPVRTVAASNSPVKRFALDAKQTRIAILREDDRIVLVNRAKDEQLWSHPNNMLGLIDVSIAGDYVFAGQVIASYVQLELDSGKSVQAVGAPDILATTTCVAFDPKARWVWLGSDDVVVQRITPGSVQSWSRRKLDHGGSNAMALAADGELLAVAGGDRTIRFVNSKSAQIDEKMLIEGLDTPALTLAFDAKAALLAAAGDDKLVRIWSMPSGRAKSTITGHDGVVRALAFDPKSSRIAIGDDKGAVKLWSVDKGALLLELPNADGRAVTDLEFVDKGKALLGACGVNGLLLWDLSKN